jgi:drug/metabolite transporter (DMT)-like permease
MKLVVFILVSIGFSLTASAQSIHQKVNYRLKVEKYNKIKKAGILLIAAGGGFAVIAGVASLNNTNNASPYSSNTNTQQTTALSGLTLGAVACLGTGIPLAIVGSAASRKYQRKLKATSVHFHFTPQGQGIGLVYRF